MSSEFREKYALQLGCIANARRLGKLGHTFLLTGDNDAIRHEFAIELSKTAACQSPGADGTPCNECRYCRMLNNGNYPELLELFPVGKSRQIPVGTPPNPEPNSVRYFIDRLFLTSSEGCKIGLINDADRLKSEAQNALLKTLEEPPDDCIIILSTAKPSVLLPTTRSRCRIISLPDNRVKFDFPGSTELFPVLERLFTADGSSLELGLRSASDLLKIISGLEESVKSQVESEWESKISRAKEFDVALAKNLNKNMESEIAGRFLSARQLLLEGIYCFASQLYLLSCGVALSDLPAGEVFEGLESLPLPPPERTEYILDAASELLNQLRFNVDEELAIRNFALKIAVN